MPTIAAVRLFHPRRRKVCSSTRTVPRNIAKQVVPTTAYVRMNRREILLLCGIA